ncbi:hypothetical protein BH24DEI1_BH24DEI1_01040 [soil metagenome]|jgi:hypothetical protein
MSVDEVFWTEAGDETRTAGERNKRRYALINDRRRALFELERLGRAVADHPRWQTAVTARPWLLHTLEAPVEELTSNLCPHAGRATAADLERDVKRLYGGLIRLARLWVKLERGSAAAERFDLG